MNRWILLLVVITSRFPAYGAERVSVQQLQQFLLQDRVAHKTDEEVAQQLSTLRLTERLTESTESQLDAEFNLGEKTSATLDLLSDLSAFLEPPANELPREIPPNSVEQQKIIHAAVNFTTSTLKQMPDILAIRTTRSFEDVPVITSDSAFQSGLHSMGSFVRETTFRNGREVPDSNTPRTADALFPNPAFRAGLNSTGEFGQDLGIIMTDAIKGKITWSHWEQTSLGLVAVFDYEVPQEVSHYRIYFCCGSNSVASAETSYEGTPAYHGSLSISPTNGAILRATLEIEFTNFDPPPHYRIATQYGPVEIGGRESILPIRSVAMGDGTTLTKKHYWLNLFIDDVRFTNYHRFGSTVRIQTH